MAQAAEYFRHDDFILLKDRPCRITGILSTRTGLCFSGLDIFNPTAPRYHEWVRGRDTLVPVPDINLCTIALLSETNVDQLEPITNPCMLAGIRAALKLKQSVTIEYVAWGDDECMIQSYSTTNGSISLMDVESL